MVGNWVEKTQQGIDGLIVWKINLQTWGQVVPIEGELFEQGLQDLNEAGLGGWLEANRAELESLRQALTVGGGGAA